MSRPQGQARRREAERAQIKFAFFHIHLNISDRSMSRCSNLLSPERVNVTNKQCLDVKMLIKQRDSVFSHEAAIIWYSEQQHSCFCGIA